VCDSDEHAAEALKNLPNLLAQVTRSKVCGRMLFYNSMTRHWPRYRWPSAKAPAQSCS
jgi:hypothetical protein